MTGCVGQRRSFSVKVVFSESSDPLFEKGLAKSRESFLLFFQLIGLVTVMCTPSPDVGVSVPPGAEYVLVLMESELWQGSLAQLEPP